MDGSLAFCRRRGISLLSILVCLGLLVLVAALFMPATRNAREAARRTRCRSNLKQIGLALHNYYDVYGTFPPAYTMDADGKPLHSWRALILPYLVHGPLYATIDLSKSWDDPVNAPAAKVQISQYSCPSSTAEPGLSSYLAILTKDSILQPGESKPIGKITDGASNTVIILEVPHDSAVPWMSPLDADDAILAAISADKSKHSHTGGYHALIADGSVRFLSQNLDPATFRALLTANGKEPIGEF